MCFENKKELYDETLRILKMKAIRHSTSRPNVSGLRKKNEHGRIGVPCRSQNFGMVYNRFKKGGVIFGASVNNLKYPELYEQLKILIREIDADFEYNTITVNHNFKCLPHYDQANKSPSIILTLGDFEGGKLIVEGCPIDIHWKPLIFNGSVCEHATEDFTGCRYSIIYYNI